MLDELDAVDWVALHGAYGPAGDVPDLLRAMGGPDAEAADKARRQLGGIACHQGTTYSVSAPVVPFLTELLVGAGTHHRGELAWLLGEMAAYNNQRTKHIAAVRAAVSAEVDRLLPLLGDADPEVRAGVAFALSQCPKRKKASLPALRARLAAEDDPQAKARVLAAAQWLDPKSDLAAGLLGEEQPVPVRAAAALAVARSELPWSEAATEAVRAGWADGEPLERCWWWSDPLGDLVAAVGERDADAARVLAMLLGSASTSVRQQAAKASVWVVRVLRESRAALVPVLAAALADRSVEVRDLAATALHEAGEAARPAADALAGSASVGAASALLQLGDPRWRALVTPANVLDVLAGIEVPADPALVEALRGTRAADWANHIRLLVADWGPAAAPLVPRLVEEYGRYLVLPALAAIGPAAADALPLLGSTVEERAAAVRIGGDPGPALEAARAAMGTADAVALLDALGEHGRALLPELRAAVAAHPDDIGLARALWRLSGDPAEVAPSVRRVLELAAAQLRQQRPRYTGDEAARLAGELGDASLVPLLRPLLDDRTSRCRVPAAKAIWRLTGDADGLLPPLLKDVTPRPPGYRWQEAFDVLAEMGAAAAAALPELRAVAEHPWCPFVRDFDSRTRRGLGHRDDAFRAAARSTVERISRG